MSEHLGCLIQYATPVTLDDMKTVAKAVTIQAARNADEFQNEWTALLDPRYSRGWKDKHIEMAYGNWRTQEPRGEKRWKICLMGDIEFSPVSR